ncbi:amino acid adenylation domain-containing protein [Streptomyces misionensis]|uniref:Amino acid adenylation domain-containing protein n=1 Tax=Streptomyces misionensis TaxID=67331 RepID=A0A5C6JWE0_9ACTN|nr:non-ribosomal peptide synthetase [Streptomyces misionensis]TWV49633.1 amino acid adenylation domain-containing protein [Streptomyces misionensis]
MSRSDTRPATAGQLRFFLLDQQDGGAARTLVKRITAEGAADPERLREALRAVLTAHPALRTSLHLDPEGLRRRVHDADAVDLVVRTTADPDALVAAESAALAVPFEHGDGPLCRIRALVGPRRTHCLVAVHHAVFDDDSTALLLTALTGAYAEPAAAAPAAGAPDDDPAPRADGERLRAFWRRYLEGCPRRTELPWTRPADGHRKRTVVRDLPAELCDRLRHRARTTGASPFAQFLGAVGAVTAWYLDRDDVVLAVPVSGRGDGGDRRIDCLQNTVPVRMDLAGADTATVADRAVDALFDALDHAELPFEEILSAVRAVREHGRKPLAQILCTETVPVPAVEAGGLRWTVGETDTGEAEYDCCLALRHLPDGGMRLELVHREGALPPERARNTVDHVARLLERLTEDPARPLASIDLLGETEEAELAVLTGAPLDADPRPVHELVLRHARTTPRALAVTDGDRELSYEALEQRSRAVARALTGREVRPGDRVGICLPRGTDLVVAVLAVWRAGAVYVPLDPEYPADRLRFIVADTAPAVVLGDRDLPGALRDTPGVLPLDMADAGAAVPADGEEGGAAPADPAGRAYILHTSGSTGRPKGVVVGHSRLTALFDACERALPEAPLTVAGTSLSFDISVLELLWPLTRGRTVLVTGHRRVAEQDVPAGALYQCTPTIARLLLADPAGRALLGRLGALLVGGEPLAPDLADELAAAVPGPVVNCYGPTETTVWSTTWRVVRGAPVRIGLPLPGESCHVRDALGRRLPPGCPGRLVIGGLGVAEGYWRRPELTAERFVALGGGLGRGYDTGDLVVLDGPEGLRFLGRRDGQCKILGQRIEVEEVEATLRAGGVPEVAVAPNADSTHLVAFLPDGVPADGVTADGPTGPVADGPLRELRAHAEAWLPPAAVPGAWLRVTALPQLPNGKLDRDTLARWAADRRPAAPAGPPPADGSTAARLCRVWETVLGRPVADHDATFFELGGTSHGVLRVLAALRADHPRLTAAELFRHTTVRALAAHLDGAAAADGPAARGAARGRDRSRALSGWRAGRRPSSTL